MSKCTQCPHAVGDSYKRDCAFPDCVGGWGQAYKDLAEERDQLSEQLRQATSEIRNLENSKLKILSVIQHVGDHNSLLQILKCYETEGGVIVHVK